MTDIEEEVKELVQFETRNSLSTKEDEEYKLNDVRVINQDEVHTLIIYNHNCI